MRGSMKAVEPSITILGIITSHERVNAIINFKNIKIKCVLGENEFIIGTSADPKEKCIAIKYTPKFLFCTLESLFYTVP